MKTKNIFLTAYVLYEEITVRCRGYPKSQITKQVNST